MKYYDNELKAIKRVNRYRNREIYPEYLRDFASNDYLGFAHKKSFLDLVKNKLDIVFANEQEVLSLINEKTRLLIINNPHNPTGSFTEKSVIDKLAKAENIDDNFIKLNSAEKELIFW